MRLVIQRVSEASVEVDQKVVAQIGIGYLLLVGIEEADDRDDVDWAVRKILSLRIFSDEEGKMNLDLNDVGGTILLVSQFTLHAKYKKGSRPSFIKAARPEHAIPLYEQLIAGFEMELGKKIGTGIFGASMNVQLVNDGPVTLFIDTRNKE
jgi:D-aminoacyl-tRNA deacylase